MRSPLRKLVAVGLLWLALWPQPVSVRDTPPVLTYGTPAKDWTVLAARLQERRDWYAWAAAQPAPASPRRSVSHGSHRGYASAVECIGAVENGGDYGRSSNPSHFGRYQFSRPTWAAYGGDPSTWGYASPTEQDAVFANAIAAGGLSNWTPYDGC